MLGDGGFAAKLATTPSMRAYICLVGVNRPHVLVKAGLGGEGLPTSILCARYPGRRVVTVLGFYMQLENVLVAKGFPTSWFRTGNPYPQVLGIDVAIKALLTSKCPATPVLSARRYWRRHTRVHFLDMCVECLFVAERTAAFFTLKSFSLVLD